MPGPARSRTRRALLVGAAAALVLALLVAAFSLALPGILSRDYDARSLSALRQQAARARQDFARILGSLAARKDPFENRALPAEPGDFFPLFREAGLDLENQGIALCDGDGFIEAWHGNILSPADQIGRNDLEELKRTGATFLARSIATVYLAVLQPLGTGTRMLVHFERLAFIPQVQSSYIREFHALGPALRSNAEIRYYDLNEDVAGWEAFFARHDDEYTGQPREEHEIQTLVFPLRNEEGRIMADVTLRSPSLTSRLTAAGEDLRLISLLALIAAALAGLAFVGSRPGWTTDRRVAFGTAGAGLIVVLRLLALPLGRLERIQSLSLFKPSMAGFRTWLGLTQSPADIFLTALAALGLAVCLAFAMPRRPVVRESRRPFAAGLLAHAAAAGFAALAVAAGYEAVRRVAFNTNLSLLRWDLDAARLTLQLGLLVFLTAVLVVLAVLFRWAFGGCRISPLSALAGAAGAAAAVLVRTEGSPLLAAVSVAIAAWLFGVAVLPGLSRRREAWVAGLVLAALWTARASDGLTNDRTRRLMETTLAHTIRTQPDWGRFLIRESLPGLDRSEEEIVAFFLDPQDRDLARALWEKTPVAKSNWYSSLEVRDAEGNAWSRFSLNVPKFLGAAPDFDETEDWAIVPYRRTIIGQDRDFLVGYRDYARDGVRLGRILLYVSLDPEMLPFLYSANPYFEVLRTESLPSLSEFDIGCEIFDLEGRSLFNPGKLTAGLSVEDLEALRLSPAPFWSTVRDRGTIYDAYLFRRGERVYSLFSPRKDLRTQAVDFLRFFFLGLTAVSGVAIAAAVAAGRASARRPLWSFSNRVYAFFLAVALVPMLLFTVFTRDLFDSLFTERFIEDSAVHASYAQGLMEAFLIIQGVELSPDIAPWEDLVFWISSTLSNDVIVYGDGVLLASSRREFFDSGLLPGILDGEAYQALVWERKPFHIQRTRLGAYSFQTLTVPYEFRNTTHFISLPFPLEKEQVNKAAREIVEFLAVLSAFFIVLVFLFSRGVRSTIIVPVLKLLAGTREVGLGNLEVRIDHQSRDEMMTLIDGFNTMIRNLKAHEQELAEMSKKVAWTEMARKVAHEIKNPLTPIQLSAEHVLKVYEDNRGDLDRALKESMSYIISEVENLRRIAQEFMEIARDTTLSKEPVDLRAILEDVLQPYRRLLEERIRFAVVAGEGNFRTRGDEAKLRTAFRNVIANAVEAISQRGEVTVTIGREDKAFAIAVRDSGPGMSAETADRIFDLYFSTKEGGTGLGLPITKKIVEEHGGTIRVSSRPGLGTTIVIELPAGQ
ncbi:MAG: HAMP domain-containing protein [Candidatus Aminicenantes bacterium]|nr:HAMP domain-containing protein [Candidatus Aminicenantes bacterium]